MYCLKLVWHLRETTEDRDFMSFLLIILEMEQFSFLPKKLEASTTFLSIFLSWWGAAFDHAVEQ